MDLLKLKLDRDFFKRNNDFESTLNVSYKIWQIEESDWNLYFLIQFLRKTRKFDDARSILSKYRNRFPLFKLLKNEELWLDYSEKIYNWSSNSNFLDDAQELLKKVSSEDKYTKEIYIRTKLNMISYLIIKKEHKKALEIIESLDFNTLSNKSYSGSSQLKIYFKFLADLILELGITEYYIKNLLNILNFTKKKENTYIQKILKEKNTESFRYILETNLKDLKDEISFREKKIFRFNYSANKTTTISSLSDFTFCPVAFAINSSYDVIPNRSINIENYTDQKWTLSVRYFEYQKSQNINHTFYDFKNHLDEDTHNSFTEIFSSRLLFNTYQNINSNFYFRNSDDTLRGIPDYIFQNKYGQKFTVIEKFTKNKSCKDNFFINDIIKILAYNYEFNSLNINFGYLIYWEYISTEDYSIPNKNVQKVTGCKIIKIYKNEDNYNLLKKTISELNNFKLSKQAYIEDHQIALSKCQNCSVKHYCNHKTGKSNYINLPYQVDKI